MQKPTLMHSGVIAAVIIAAVLGVSIVNGFPTTKPFISVDPLSDKNIGDHFTVTGTTNLPAGTKLLFEVYPSSFEPTATGEFSGATGTIEVTRGTGDTNTWSADLELLPSYFLPKEYLVNVSLFTGDVSKGEYSPGSPFAITKFTVHPGSGTSGTSQSSDHTVAGGILIDPIRDIPRGDLLVVSGKTNLSAGTDLLVRVVPVLMQQGKLTGDYQHPENSALIKVVKDTGINNRFSVSLDTRLLPLADHIVTVSGVKGTAAGISSEPGPLSGTLVFNIIAGKAGTSQNSSEPAIYINPFDEITRGDPLVISGTTNVPAGSKFQVSVIPSSSTDYEHRELAAIISALKGSTTANLFSVTLATKDLPKGEHIVIVSAEDYETTGTLLFTVK